VCPGRWVGHPLRCVCRVPTRDGAHGMHWHAEPGLQLEGWCMYHLPCFIVCDWCPLVWQGSVLTKRTARAAHHRQTCGPHLQQLRLWAVHGSQGIPPGCIRCNVTPCVGQAASATHCLWAPVAWHTSEMCWPLLLCSGVTKHLRLLCCRRFFPGQAWHRASSIALWHTSRAEGAATSVRGQVTHMPVMAFQKGALL
jgi:hypothetical protein